MLFSVIVPVYNRPDEIDELLGSLTNQTFNDFEVLIVEDGSEKDCRTVVERYSEKLNIRYFLKENSGQGFSRNYGFNRAEGEYLVVFDSDCLIPEHYFETAKNYLEHHSVDAWGGPDRAHPDFSPIQKAISYAMTSSLTTGGIRGRKHHAGVFHPRSFNMGISREVFEETGGYKITRMGEDIEFSIRIQNAGFKTVLIEDAYVYHKRRTDLKQFYRQLHFFGRARINIKRFYPDQVKPIHTLPSFFVLGLSALILLLILNYSTFIPLLLIFLIYFGLIFLGAFRQEKSLKIAFLGVAASFIQLTAYGIGFLQEYYTYLVKDSK